MHQGGKRIKFSKNRVIEDVFLRCGVIYQHATGPLRGEGCVVQIERVSILAILG